MGTVYHAKNTTDHLQFVSPEFTLKYRKVELYSCIPRCVSGGLRHGRKNESAIQKERGRK